MKWKSDARGKDNEKDGSIFNLKENGMDISIHKYVGCGNKLYLTCSELKLSQVSLQTEDFEEAVRIAKYKITQRMRYLESECKKFISDETENEFSRW